MAVVGVRVAVIGGGSWGTTVAHLFAHRSRAVLYARDRAVADAVNEEGANPRYLPGHALHPGLRATDDLQAAVEDADVVVMAVPSQGFRAVLQQLRPYVGPSTTVLSLTKGLETDTAMRMTEVASDELPGCPVGVLTGPNLAKEIMAGHATAAVLAMTEPSAAERVHSALAVSHFRIYTGADVVGAEMAGATKNVIALASGIADGLGAGDNTKAALITRGAGGDDPARGSRRGDPLTFAGLAGMGDLVATCMSAQSRNRHVGERLGRGASAPEIVSAMGQVAEGVRSTPVVVSLARSLGVDMPIAEAVQSVLKDARSAAEAYRALLDRPLTSEIH